MSGDFERDLYERLHRIASSQTWPSTLKPGTFRKLVRARRARLARLFAGGGVIAVVIAGTSIGIDRAAGPGTGSGEAAITLAGGPSATPVPTPTPRPTPTGRPASGCPSHAAPVRVQYSGARAAALQYVTNTNFGSEDVSGAYIARLTPANRLRGYGQIVSSLCGPRARLVTIVAQISLPHAPSGSSDASYMVLFLARSVGKWTVYDQFH